MTRPAEKVGERISDAYHLIAVEHVEEDRAIAVGLFEQLNAVRVAEFVGGELEDVYRDCLERGDSVVAGLKATRVWSSMRSAGANGLITRNSSPVSHWESA